MAASFSALRLPVLMARRQPSLHGVSRRLASSAATQTHNPAYPLYPSVIQLLHEKGIPESEVSKIPASGPKGRLLKGDVLAYLGSIAADYPAAQQARFEKLSHLDLSNIKLAPAPQPVETKAPAAVEEAAAVAAAPAPPATISVAVSVSLAAVLSVQNKLKESLGVTVPLATFLARATDLANDDLPRSATQKPTADELFDEILGASPVKTSRGEYFPELNTLEAADLVTPKKTVKKDLIDYLAGSSAFVKKSSSSPSPITWLPSEEYLPGSAANVFSLTVPQGDEKRAKAFLERVRVLLQVEPGRLVL
ncbi:hypothetical protein ASPZODRAFT_130636 [Penicilliopsis zonata CBS 506.65]|uniref:Peripheral subunit-binding (PSBD) domain-containing protein n=1 Tax=Penicilliopsis zonata CBS 506.65 TaxID=1073090 RepID=A0A1L9SNE6_9EURO|nr:hypothetical protein ASPZODRAFT_130636 [Penicilliopsis zonata CBS 506.65]OJJ48567.1 hypothetical protein ASPZODRAFT_130636 [Penicilliopsis zonata CBS 506.65]